MRGDRLLAIMMLLQARGKMTAQALARELEVSRRTILRDIDALSIAGVPIYADGGHGGGIELDARYRTTLTGLTEAEALTVFISESPQLLRDLGYQEQARQSLLKLFASLPTLHRNAIEQFRQRVHIDPVWWWNEASPPFWDALQRAVYDAQLLRMTYTRSDGTVGERTVEPYSLVAKAGVWYLVARRDGEFRTYRVSRIREAEILETPFQRLPDFDLETYWRAHTGQVSAQIAPYAFAVRCNDQGLAFLRRRILDVSASPDGTGWHRAEIHVSSAEEARMLVFGLGTDGMVIAPGELREDVARRARDILNQAGE
ncbi:MAG: helix-turn-helix transcriptional regulator [Nitrososphaerota archaeon]